MTTLLEQLISTDFTLDNSNKRFAKAVEHSSLVLDRDKDRFYWNSRSVSGDALTWLTRIKGMGFSEAVSIAGGYKDYDDLPSVVEKEDEKEVVYDRLLDVFFENGKADRSYWYDYRGYTDTTIDRFKLGSYDGWFSIPIFENGKLVNFQMRKVFNGGKQMRYWYKGGPHLFNASILSNTNWVILTEGPPDAILLRQLGLPAMSHTAGATNWKPDWTRYFLKLKRIYIVYDNDDAGRLGANHLGELFGDRCRLYNFDGYPEKFDTTDFIKLGKTREDYMDLLENESKSFIAYRGLFSVKEFMNDGRKDRVWNTSSTRGLF